MFRCVLTGVDDCRPSSCNYQGRCIDGINGFTCKCAAGYYGLHCDMSAEDEALVLTDKDEGADCLLAISCLTFFLASISVL